MRLNNILNTLTRTLNALSSTSLSCVCVNPSLSVTLLTFFPPRSWIPQVCAIKSCCLWEQAPMIYRKGERGHWFPSSNRCSLKIKDVKPAASCAFWIFVLRQSECWVLIFASSLIGGAWLCSTGGGHGAGVLGSEIQDRTWRKINNNAFYNK